MFRISDTEISVSCRELQLRLIDLVKTGCGVRSMYLCNFIFGEVLRNLEVLGRLTADVKIMKWCICGYRMR